MAGRSSGSVARSATMLLMPGFTACQHCPEVLPPGKLKCPKCHGWNISRKKRVDNDDDASYTLLSEIKRGKRERLSIGALLDPLVGGGLPLTSTMLLGGMAGAGKSTACVQMTDAVIDCLDSREETRGRKMLYITAEQSKEEVQEIADRVVVEHADRLAITSVRGGAFDIDELFEEVEPGLVVVDSLQGLIGPVGKDAESILLCERLKDHALDRQCPAIILSHVNKDKEASGVYTLQHNVDAVMLALIGTDEEEEDEEVDEDVRTLHVLKNRYGRAPCSRKLRMTEHGLENA